MKTLTIASLALLCCAQAVAADVPVLVLSKTIPLPDIKGGFNHHSADGKLHRLFVCANTNQSIEVLDLDTGKVVKSLPGDKPAAVCFAVNLNLICVARGKNLQLYDGKSFELLATMAMPNSLDELHYDAASKQLFVGCMTAPSEGIAAIDLVQRKLLGVASIPKPQGFCLEDNGDRIFACTPVANQVSVMDRKKLTAAAPWKLTDVQYNYSIAYDSATHRLFVGCRQPAKLLIFNTDTGKVVGSVSIGADTDDLSFDPVNKRVYVYCGEGVISVIQQDSADSYRNIATVKSAVGARNGLFIPETAEVCVSVPQGDKQPATVLVYRVLPAK